MRTAGFDIGENLSWRRLSDSILSPLVFASVANTRSDRAGRFLETSRCGRQESNPQCPYRGGRFTGAWAHRCPASTRSDRHEAPSPSLDRLVPPRYQGGSRGQRGFVTVSAGLPGGPRRTASPWGGPLRRPGLYVPGDGPSSLCQGSAPVIVGNLAASPLWGPGATRGEVYAVLEFCGSKGNQTPPPL